MRRKYIQIIDEIDILLILKAYDVDDIVELDNDDKLVLMTSYENINIIKNIQEYISNIKIIEFDGWEETKTIEIK